MLNSELSRSAKEQGQQIALSFAGDDWRERVLAELRAWCASRVALGFTEMAMEQFRAVALNQPPRPQAWGALASVACRAGIIAPVLHHGVPVYRAAESVKTHGHPIRVYSLTGARTATSHDTQPAEAGNNHFPRDRVGESRHSLAAGGEG